MPKKKGAVTLEINGKEVGDISAALGIGERPYFIKQAAIKDDICNYAFEITDGTGAGDTHNVKGSAFIEDDMRFAFGKLNVHLACIDDVFLHAGVEVTSIQDFNTHELATRYNVTAFKIAGGGEDEQVVLQGSKYVSSSGGRIDLSTPKIPLDNLSSYTWAAELRDAVQEARDEVAAYKEGKCIVQDREDQDNPKQLTIGDQMASDEESEADFENAKI